MVHICTPDFSATCGWVGCTFGPWASGGIFDQPVPLEVSRFRLEKPAPTWTGSGSAGPRP